MIKLYQQKTKSASKESKRTFVPFQNERDNLGRIIRPRTQQKNQFNILKIFENLKKSSKEYFFEKDFKKLEKRFQTVKRNLQQDKDYNYEKEINQCLNIVHKLNESKQEKERNKQNLYVNLREKIDNKIYSVKSDIRKFRKSREIQSSFGNRTTPPQYILKDVQKHPKYINVDLFKTLSSRSEMMATFCQQGLKYSQFVETKKFNPWKKWYKKCQYELFPGKKVVVRQLQKSIY